MEATQVIWLRNPRASVSLPVEKRQHFSRKGCEGPSRKGEKVPSFNNTTNAQAEFLPCLFSSLALAGLMLK